MPNYSGRNQVSESAYRQTILALRERNDFSSAQLAVVIAYAKASDNPAKAVQLRAAAAELASELTAGEKSAVNSILAAAGAEGVA